MSWHRKALALSNDCKASLIWTSLSWANSEDILIKELIEGKKSSQGWPSLMLFYKHSKTQPNKRLTSAESSTKRESSSCWLMRKGSAEVFYMKKMDKALMSSGQWYYVQEGMDMTMEKIVCWRSTGLTWLNMRLQMELTALEMESKWPSRSELTLLIWSMCRFTLQGS